MTTGSAASMALHDPRVALSFFGEFRRPEMPQTTAWGAPPRRSPSGLATCDPPRGKILLASEQAVIALDLQRTLRDAGYRIVGPVSSTSQAERLLARSSVDCAVVDLDAQTAAEVGEVLSRSGIPTVFLGGSETLPEKHVDKPLVQKPFDSHRLLAAIEKAMSSVDYGIHYAIAPPAIPWPRVMPQL